MQEDEIKDEEQDWEPIDVSKGTFRDKELYQTSKFRSHFKKEIRGILPKASQREELSRLILEEREKGLTKREIKQGLKKLREEGKLSTSQEKKLRRKFGAF